MLCICPEEDTNIKFTDRTRKKETQISRVGLENPNLNDKLHLLIHSGHFYGASSGNSDEGLLA